MYNKICERIKIILEKTKNRQLEWKILKGKIFNYECTLPEVYQKLEISPTTFFILNADNEIIFDTSFSHFNNNCYKLNETERLLQLLLAEIKKIEIIKLEKQKEDKDKSIIDALDYFCK
jgi:hypothetical protein